MFFSGFSIITLLEKNDGMPALPLKLIYYYKFISATITGRLNLSKKNCCILTEKYYEEFQQITDMKFNGIVIIISDKPDYSRDKIHTWGSEVISKLDLENALNYINNERKNDIESIFVIGDCRLINSALLHPQCKIMYALKIAKEILSDEHLNSTYKTIFSLNESMEEITMQYEKNTPFQLLQYKSNMFREPKS